MNLDDEISMILSLQSIYNMFKVVNSDLLGINMNVLSKKGIYVRIYRKQDFYVTMEEYKTSQYHCDREYYINIIRTVLEYICIYFKIRDTSIITTLYVLPHKASSHTRSLSTVSASAVLPLPTLPSLSSPPLQPPLLPYLQRWHSTSPLDQTRPYP